jgi:hypothetical protein
MQLMRTFVRYKEELLIIHVYYNYWPGKMRTLNKLLSFILVINSISAKASLMMCVYIRVSRLGESGVCIDHCNRAGI